MFVIKFYGKFCQVSNNQVTLTNVYLQTDLRPFTVCFSDRILFKEIRNYSEKISLAHELNHFTFYRIHILSHHSYIKSLIQ